METSQTTARRRAYLGVALTLAIIALSGCGSRGNVHGKVYYKDKLLSSGTVVFTANKKTVGTSTIKEDGSYEMKNVPAGEVTITVSPSAVLPPKKDKTVVPQGLDDPEKYTVTKGEQEREIRLK